SAGQQLWLISKSLTVSRAALLYNSSHAGKSGSQEQHRRGLGHRAWRRAIDCAYVAVRVRRQRLESYIEGHGNLLLRHATEISAERECRARRAGLNAIMWSSACEVSSMSDQREGERGIIKLGNVADVGTENEILIARLRAS